MTELFLKLLNMSITAGWLIIAAVLLRQLLKKTPRSVICILWALVGVRLVCPFTIESALSLIPSAEIVSTDILYSQEPEIHSGISVLNSAVNPVISDALAPNAAESANPVQIIAYAASLIWIAGMAALLIYAAVSSIRLHRRVKTAVRLRGKIMQSENISAPFILGIFRPRIYLPFGMDEQQLECVAAHEEAHLRRRDHLWKPLGFLLLSVYWFNPLTWVAYCLLCRDIELACDERVIRELSAEEKKTYSSALLLFSVPQKMISACPLAFGEVGVKERIKSVLSYKKPALWLLLAAAVGIILLAVCFLTNPKPSEDAAPPFGHSYEVGEILYDAPVFSFTYTESTAPHYMLTEDYSLLVSGEISAEELTDEWISVGTAEEFALDEMNFDRCFISANGASGWRGDVEAAEIRSSCKSAWQVISPVNESDTVRYILLCDNGDVYLAHGYRAEDGSLHIRWLFRLVQTSEENVTDSTDSNTTAEASDIPAAEYTASELKDGMTLVSTEYVYMTPFSSYSSVGDSGFTYHIGADSFTLTNRSADSSNVISPVKWGWQAFPFTDEEWRAMYQLGGDDKIIGQYDEILYQPLSEKYFLLRTDGRVQLVETYSDSDSHTESIHSICTLIPQEALGAAQWSYNPLLSSQYPAFRFDTELPLDSISVLSVGGELVDGESRTVRAERLDVEAGNGGFYWSPAVENGGTFMSAQILISSSDNACNGTIYISGVPSEDGFTTLYSASFAGKEMKLEQSDNGGRIVQP